jgi:hypothetical protein
MYHARMVLPFRSVRRCWTANRHLVLTRWDQDFVLQGGATASVGNTESKHRTRASQVDHPFSFLADTHSVHPVESPPVPVTRSLDGLFRILFIHELYSRGLRLSMLVIEIWPEIVIQSLMMTWLHSSRELFGIIVKFFERAREMMLFMMMVMDFTTC